MSAPPNLSSKYYVNRQQYQAAVEQAVSNLGREKHNVLVFYGAAGIGKTELRKQLAIALKRNCAVLNGAGMKKYSAPSLEVGIKLLWGEWGRCGIDTKCLALAYGRYHALAYPHQPFDATGFSNRMERADAFSTWGDFVTSDMGADIAELMSYVIKDAQATVPVFGSLSKLTWLLMKYSQPLWDWCSDRLTDLKELDQCTEAYEFLEKLPIFLARDLRYALREGDRPFVVLIDGYEDLLDQSGMCEWLEQLMVEPNPHVLWVLFSERSLADLALPERAVMAQVPVLPIMEAESWEWLQREKITDEQIGEAIVRVAQGVPGYLSIGIATYQDIKKRRSPALQDFAQHLQEQVGKSYQAWDADEQRVFRALALPRTWDQALFEWLMAQLGLEPGERLSKVAMSPYVESVAEPGLVKAWRLQPQMGQHLRLSISEGEERATHNQLFHYFQASYLSVEQPTGKLLAVLAEALYHGRAGNQPEEAIAWVLEQVQKLQSQGWHQVVVLILEPLVQGSDLPQRLENLAISERLQALTWGMLGRSHLALYHWEEALKWLDLAQQFWGTLHLQQSLEGAIVEFDLAWAYLQLGRTFDAKNAAQRALSIQTMLLGADSLEVAETLNRIAMIVIRQPAKGLEAINLNQQALEIFQAHPQTTPLQLAELKLTAAELRRDVLKTQFDQAVQLVMEALQLAQTHGGEDHLLAISSRGTLGSIYEKMGNRAQAAFDQYQTALNGAEVILGLDHPQTLHLLRVLSRFCQKSGQTELAQTFAERHNISVQLGNFEATAATATRLNNVGYTLCQKGEYGKAEPLWVTALSIHRKVCGQDHPDTAQSLSNLAWLYGLQGRHSEAEPLLLQALEITRLQLGQDHLSTATSLNNLALSYRSQGRHSEAEPLLLQALEIARSQLGQDHPDTAQSLNNLALSYESQGRHSEAEPLLLQALEIRRSQLGHDHLETANSLNNLADLYRSQGRYKEAETLYEKTLAINRKVLGTEHPHTRIAENHLQQLRSRASE